jgi:hypothetical protein
MDFKDQIKQLGERVDKLKDSVKTEEATKNAFIMPFIRELGYDVFNPFEVTPELVADIGMKQGEKIDYAIMQDGKPIILIECKWHGAPLNVNNASQLFRYFHTTSAKFSILTNGIEYRFYTDLVTPNKMDDEPFFAFDITKIKEAEIEELKKFHKTQFNFENIVNTASELKYMNGLRTIIHKELQEPSPDFVRHFAKSIYPGIVTAKVLEQFTHLTKRSFSQYINDLITDRFQSALTKETELQRGEEEVLSETVAANSLVKIETTQEELEGFYIVRAILRSKVSGDRIAHRDAQSYFAILLDDNNRKTICRLYFSASRKQISVFDSNKMETKYELKSLDDIYNYTSVLLAAVENYDKAKSELQIN